MPETSPKWTPQQGYILARTLTANDIKDTKLSLPSNSRQNDSAGLGEVVAVPDDSQFKIGDIVAFMPFTDVILDIDHVKHSILKAEDVRAVLR